VIWLKRNWGLLVVGATLILIYSLLPLGTALEFGRDEGYEVIKPFLCTKGFVLYKDIWNDQPPIFTVLLTWAFKAWGPTIRVARLVAAGFGLLLFVTFFQLVRQRSGLWASLLAAFLLLASPAMLQLSVSVMLETPAFATALVSALLLFQWSRRPHWGWLLASGAVMGIALQIKLTAALIVPAMLVEMALTRWSSRSQSWTRATAFDLAQWGATVVALFLAIGLVWASGSFQSSFQSHFMERPVPSHGRAEDYVLPAGLLRQHVDGLGGAVIGLALLVRRKHWREYMFPAVLLLTAAAIHAVHRPWWNYYYLHLAIPLAWLAGVGVKEIISAATTFRPKASFRLISGQSAKGVALCALAALLLARPEKRLEANIRDLRRRPTIVSSLVVKTMKQYAERTHWAYADPVIYPFHAQVLVPPELAIVMLKRFWSGQITTAAIVEACKRYHAEQLVLPATPAPEWRELLANEYTPACAEQGWVLYVANSIYQPPNAGAAKVIVNSPATLSGSGAGQPPTVEMRSP